MLGPTQAFPPWAGVGLVQLLVLVLAPPPHFSEQSEYAPQSVYLPSTAQEVRNTKWRYNFGQKLTYETIEKSNVNIFIDIHCMIFPN